MLTTRKIKNALIQSNPHLQRETVEQCVDLLIEGWVGSLENMIPVELPRVGSMRLSFSQIYKNRQDFGSGRKDTQYPHAQVAFRLADNLKGYEAIP